MQYLLNPLENCFRKAGISTESQESVIAEDDPFKELQDEIDALRSVQPDLITEDIDAASLTDVDADLQLYNPHLPMPKS